MIYFVKDVWSSPVSPRRQVRERSVLWCHLHNLGVTCFGLSWASFLFIMVKDEHSTNTKRIPTPAKNDLVVLFSSLLPENPGRARHRMS